MMVSYLGMELELNNGAGSSLDVVGVIFQACVGIGDRDNLDNELLWVGRAWLPVTPITSLAGFAAFIMSTGAPVWRTTIPG